MIEMPRPWRERATTEAALLAPPRVAQDLRGPEPRAQSIASLLEGKVELLGGRSMVCDVHGPYTSTGRRLRTAFPVETWSRCAGCELDEQAALRRKRDAADATARRERLEKALERSALPTRFADQTFETYVAETPAQVEALAQLRSFADSFDGHLRRGTTMILTGGVGTGKSHLAGAVMTQLMGRYDSLYVTLMTLVRMVRDTWRKDSLRSETQVLSDLARVDLLVIDEVGVQYGTDAEKLVLFEVLDRRYMDRKPSILLTNLSAGEFKAFVGDRVFDRLREVGVRVKFDWDSHRSRVDAS